MMSDFACTRKRRPMRRKALQWSSKRGSVSSRFRVVRIEFTIVDAVLLFLCWWLQLLCCYYFLAHIRTRILISRCCVAVLVLVVTTAMLLLLCLNSNTRILNSKCCVFCCYSFLTQIRSRSNIRRSRRSTATATQHVLVFFA